MNQKAEVERLAQLRLGKESLPHVNAGDAPEWRSHDGVSSYVGGAFAENDAARGCRSGMNQEAEVYQGTYNNGVTSVRNGCHSWWYPLNIILLNMADQLKFRLKNEALFREQHDTIESIGRCLLLVGQVRVVRERGAVREQSAVWKGSECFVRLLWEMEAFVELFLCSRFVRAIRVSIFSLGFIQICSSHHKILLVRLLKIGVRGWWCFAQHTIEAIANCSI